MVLSATTLVPSSLTRCVPDVDLTALFVQAPALLVVGLMLSTALLLFVLFFLPMLPVLLALSCHLCLLKPCFVVSALGLKN